jgi:drug/metabolite transporter (DMT)-like permease
MFTWLTFALLAPAINTVANYIDKFVVEKKVKDYRGVPIYGAIAGLVFGTLYWIIRGFPIIKPADGIIVVLTGVLTLWGYALYFNALSKNQTSYIVGLFQMIPVLTLILSFVFLKEVIMGPQLVGFVFILGAAVALSVNKGESKFELNSAFYLILLADLFFAMSNVMIKFALTADSFTKIISYESWGVALGGLVIYLFFPTVRSSFLESTRTVGKSVMSIMFLNELITISGRVTSFVAISLGPITLVSVLGSMQVFYGIAFGSILTLFVPSVFKEDISKKGLIKKLSLMAIMFIGVWLVY